MKDPVPEITSDQQHQLKATTLQDGMNAWDFVLSKAEADQPWIAAGILSCIEKGYSLNPLTINWEARDLRYGK
jgi:hypothetical protein